ncbi:MAG: TonB-dependent receptor, partial [Proteobacteria bacterium]|nr:TonB-dependent receptor [Pseudomonadota bacterium]
MPLSCAAVLVVTSIAHGQTPRGKTPHRQAPDPKGDASAAAASEPPDDIMPEAVETGDEPETAEVEALLVTGTRFKGRSAMESAVPIDSFRAEALQQQGNGDMTEVLRNIVPSFAATAYTGDGSAFIRSSSLRGLPPDETLVLVNRKRRHRSALVALGGAAMNQGAQAVDIGMIPSVALRSMEVLRDGAAAQYGSDAIAGVINFILKDDPQGMELQAKAGRWYEGEYEVQVAGNVGVPLGPDGFLSLSAEYMGSEELSRGGQHAEAQKLTNLGIPNVPNPAQIWGRPASSGLRTFWNGGFSLSEYFEPYFFGNFARTYGNYSFFYREPNKEGVTSTLPVNPLNPFEGNFSWSDPHLWPVGFTPRFEGRITDLSQTAGVRGEFGPGILYDVSGSYGRNRINYTLNNSINPSWGFESPTVFRPGDLQQDDLNVNADFSYGVRDNLNLAWGAEWRQEKYTMHQGDDASWMPGRWAAVGGLIDPVTNLPYQPPLVGANGYQGTSPAMAGSWARTNWALYADMEWDVTDEYLVQTAARFEDFSSFGSTLNGKLATRYILAEYLTLRGALSTGFRAPTPGQSNLTNVATVFVPGTIEQQITGTVRPTDPIASLHGGRPLVAEKSLNVSLGFTMRAAESLRLTADVYRIAVNGRIVMATDIPVQNNPTYRIIRFYT